MKRSILLSLHESLLVFRKAIGTTLRGLHRISVHFFWSKHLCTFSYSALSETVAHSLRQLLL